MTKTAPRHPVARQVPRSFTLDEQTFNDVVNLAASLPFNHQVNLPDGARIVAGQLVNRLLELSQHPDTSSGTRIETRSPPHTTDASGNQTSRKGDRRWTKQETPSRQEQPRAQQAPTTPPRPQTWSSPAA